MVDRLDHRFPGSLELELELTRFGGRFVTYVVSVSLSICIS
jgi:hypothetical protein